MIAVFIDFLMDGVFGLLNGFFSIFPKMPFSADDVSDYVSSDIVETSLAWANYFLPLDIAAAAVGLWAAVMMAYVGVKQALRYTGEII